MATGDTTAPPPSDPRDRPTANAPAAAAGPGSGGSDQPAVASVDELERRQRGGRARRRRTVLIFLLALGGVVLLWSAIYVVPEWLNRRDFATPAERATAVNAARIPVAAIFAAAVAGLGVWVSHRGVVTARQTLAQTRHRDDDTSRLAQAGQYTDRYIKAIGLISDDKLSARLGGLYALEQLAKEAPLTYHATIVDVLSAYIRERAPWPPPAPAGPAAPRPRSQRRVPAGHLGPVPPQQETPHKLALDIQAALTILGRRDLTDGVGLNRGDHRLDLSESHLEGANLFKAHLERADLSESHLEGAFLNGAHLQDAYLDGAHLGGIFGNGAHLDGAGLSEARLEDAFLSQAHLQGANLRRAHLQGAHLYRAYLQDADLSGAHVGGADLSEAHLEGTSLRGAHLEGADFRGAYLLSADLSGAALEGADLDGADLSGAHLDDGALSREQLATVVFDHGPRRPDSQSR